MYALIGTWSMSLEGLRSGEEILKSGGMAADAVVRAVACVEDNPRFSSVGFGGLPGRDGRVTLDAAFMDGETLRVGGIIAAEHIKTPVRAARLLCGRERDCLLSGQGAEEFALKDGLPLSDMLTQAAKTRWREALGRENTPQNAYHGHDTVCVLGLDENGRMASGVSTSGLFMKERGRVGDSPLPGCGFYCDARFGGAAATGLGEDIMRGCLSYETVALMKRGASPMQACEEALNDFLKRTAGEGKKEISLIALSSDGRFGAATALDEFPYCAAAGGAGASVFAVANRDGRMAVRQADASEFE